MFLQGIRPGICSRCLCNLVEGDYTIVLVMEDNSESIFCYECGVKEMAHATDSSVKEIEEHWRSHFKIDDLFKEAPHENVQS